MSFRKCIYDLDKTLCSESLCIIKAICSRNQNKYAYTYQRIYFLHLIFVSFTTGWASRESWSLCFCTYQCRTYLKSSSSGASCSQEEQCLTSGGENSCKASPASQSASSETTKQGWAQKHQTAPCHKTF